jgi:hypothetical protein
MPENDKDQQLDALLDSLLSEYSAVEPRPGLEMRIRAGMRAHATRAQRRWAWTLVFTVSAAVFFLTAWLVRARIDTSRPPSQMVEHKETAGTTTKQAAVIPPAALRTRPLSLHVARTAANKTRALIQMARATHGDGLVFEREQSYVAPAPQEAETAGEQQVPGDKIDIRTLDVDSIEIKELVPARSDEKGSL